MNKVLVSCLTLLALVTASQAAKKPATTTASGKSFIGAGVGLTDVSSADAGYSLMLTAGKPLPDVAKNFGVEGTFSTAIIKPETRGTKFDVTTAAGYATWYFDLSPQVSIMPKVGIAYVDVGTDDDFELSYGFKLNYPLESKNTLYLDYTVFNTDQFDTSILSVGMLFPF